MPWVTCNGVRVEALEGWEVRKTVVLEATIEDAEWAPLRVVVTCEARALGASLRQHVQRELLRAALRHRRVRVVASDNLEVAGRRAIRTRVYVSNDGEELEQLYVHVQPTADEPDVVSVVLTGPAGSADAMGARMRDLLVSARFTDAMDRARAAMSRSS